MLQKLGAMNDDDAKWAGFSSSLNSFAGQTVYLSIEAADASGDSLVEAAIDDVQIVAQQVAFAHRAECLPLGWWAESRHDRGAGAGERSPQGPA